MENIKKMSAIKNFIGLSYINDEKKVENLGFEKQKGKLIKNINEKKQYIFLVEIMLFIKVQMYLNFTILKHSIYKLYLC